MCSNSECDASIEQSRTLVNCPMNALNFKSFKQSEDRLDKFYFETLKVPAKSSLEKLLQLLFVLHNDQAEVERGYSYNTALLGNSMKGEAITSRRRIKDCMYAYTLELYQVGK